MKLTPSQEKVFRSFTAGANIFLTGKGGSGKSFLTRLIIDWCKERKKSVMICAPTGVAALNIGGSTIHRTFGIKVDDFLVPLVIKPQFEVEFQPEAEDFSASAIRRSWAYYIRLVSHASIYETMY